MHRAGQHAIVNRDRIPAGNRGAAFAGTTARKPPGGHRHARRITHWLVPAVFIAVGLLILITSGTLTAIN